MPRRPLPRRQPKIVHPNGTQSLREQFANRLAQLGVNPQTGPLLVRMWDGLPPFGDPELQWMAAELLKMKESEV